MDRWTGALRPGLAPHGGSLWVWGVKGGLSPQGKERGGTGTLLTGWGLQPWGEARVKGKAGGESWEPPRAAAGIGVGSPGGVTRGQPPAVPGS